MSNFDPEAWVRDYEALGGHVEVLRLAPKGEEPSTWLGITLCRAGGERARHLHMQLSDHALHSAVAEYLLIKRGIGP